MRAVIAKQAAQLGQWLAAIAAAATWLLVIPSAAAQAATEASAAPKGQAAGGAERSYFRSSREGWFWYQDPELEAPAPLPPKPAPKPLTGTEKDLADFAAFKKSFEEAMHAAVQNPTPANSARFLELLSESRRKARTFSDTVRVAKSEMPWLSASAEGVRPTSPQSAMTHDRMSREQRIRILQGLGGTHGLYFFYRSDCPYCHNFAPLLKQFEQTYGIKVFAVSIDGGSIPHFPNAVRDNGTFMRILTDAQIPPDKVQVPFTALVQPRTHEVMPIGFGAMTADEVAERIETTLLVNKQRQKGGFTEAGLHALQGPAIQGMGGQP